MGSQPSRAEKAALAGDSSWQCWAFQTTKKAGGATTTYFPCASYFCVSMIPARVIWEQETSIVKMPPLDWPVVKFLNY